MQPATHFAAPWGKMLRLISLAASVILVGVWVIISNLAPQLPGLMSALTLAPLVIIFSAAVFTIRGYYIQNDVLYVKRLGWTSRIPLAGLKTATHDSDALDGSIRLIGNGGLFAFHGLFYNKSLGRFRAYLTDTKRSVVLQLPDRIVVISPDDPARFINELLLRGLFTARLPSG